jgi:hypothetical protein
MEKQNAEQWDGVKLDVLAQAYMEVRRDMWSLLASRVGEKWQLLEAKVCFSIHTPCYSFLTVLKCMEKGLKNLSQASRSALKKQDYQGTYDYEDSGIGISDLDEESEDHQAEVPLPIASGSHYPQYPGNFQAQQQRVPSIQSMLHPHPMHYQHIPQQ